VKALQAAATERRMAIRSGHGVGKSTLLAWIVLWFISTRVPCKIGTTAPTERQLKDILWTEIGT
jgi:phage terminase large subunit